MDRMEVGDVIDLFKVVIIFNFVGVDSVIILI